MAKIPVTVWLTRQDADAVEEVLGRLHRANKHVVSVAAIRAGLELLRKQPEQVLRLTADQRIGKNIGLR
jgi:hypothetical protein